MKEAHSTEIAEAIQSFCSKYPQNPCIITSRPKLLAVAPLETFTTVEAMPLTKEQAITLASKIWPGEEKTIEFCKQLDESLFEKYKDFAETPLLLSMMFLTFMRNNSVPDHLADFYQKAYDALYCTHDSQNKGFFRRDFQCYTLIEGQFKMLFSHFCFHTYFDEVYEFTKEEIISYLKKSIERYKLASVTAEAFLSDLQFVVCLIIQDGECFRFSHRSFQTYFAAYYSANVLTDEEQQNLYKYLLSQTIFLEDDDYYSLLFQLQPERFSANVLEKGLKELKESLVPEQDPDKAFLKKEIVTITAGSIFQGKPSIMLRIPSASQEELYRYNLIELFSALLYPRYSNKASLNENCNGDTALKVKDIIRKSPCCTRSGDGYSVLLADLDITTAITDEERDFVYEVFIKEYEIHETRMAIMHWLSELEIKRDSLSRPGFIDDL